MSNFKPVIILGAPRSGTNMLRDVLTSLDNIGTWPCDEINYIWRHGNIGYPGDDIPAANAGPAVTAFIRKAFGQIARQQQVGVVVEKTCANCLRVPFVYRIFPEAKYVYIFRDGIDAAGSAKLRWSAELDLPYILKKVRYVPFTDLPYYAMRYLWTRIYRLFSSEKRLAFWGPQFPGMQEALKKHSLNEICALQWQACVESAEAGLADIPASQVCRVRYEDFVREPAVALKEVLAFIGEQRGDGQIAAAVAGVSANSLGKGRLALGDKEVKRLESLVAKGLKRYGYL